MSALAAVAPLSGARAQTPQTPCVAEGVWSTPFSWTSPTFGNAPVTLRNGMLITKGVYARKGLVWGEPAQNLFPLRQEVFLLDPDNPQQPVATWVLQDDDPDLPTWVLSDGVPLGSAHVWSHLGDALIVGGKGNDTLPPGIVGSRDTIRFRPDAPGSEWFREPQMVVRRHRPSATLVPPGPFPAPQDEWRMLVTSGQHQGAPQDSYEVFTPHRLGGALPGAWDPAASPGPGPSQVQPALPPMDPRQPRQMLADDGFADVLALRGQGSSIRWDSQVAPPANPWSTSISIQPLDLPIRHQATMIPRPGWPWMTNQGDTRRIFLYTDSSDGDWVYLVRPGSCTWSFDFDQRLVPLPVKDRGEDPESGLHYVTFDVPGPADPQWPLWRQRLRPGYWLLWVAKGNPQTSQPSHNSLIVRVTP